MPDDAALSHAQSVAGAVQRSQGGTTVNQGPDGSSGPAVLGDHRDPTSYTRQEDNRDGSTKNKMHDV